MLCIFSARPWRSLCSVIFLWEAVIDEIVALLLYWQQPDLADVAGGTLCLHDRPNFQRKLAGFCNLDCANLFCFEILKVASVFDFELTLAPGNLELDGVSSLTFAVALKNPHFEFRGVSNFDVPLGPVFDVCPVDQCVFVRLRLVPQQFSVSDHIVSPQYSCLILLTV